MYLGGWGPQTLPCQQAGLFPQAVIYCYITAVPGFCWVMPRALVVGIWGEPPSSVPIRVISPYPMHY